MKEEKKAIQKYEPFDKGITAPSSPQMRLRDLEDRYIAEVKISPEWKKNFKYNINKNGLEVRISKTAEKSTKREVGGFSIFRMVAAGINLFRYFPFTKEVDKKNIKEEYINDILTITIPKKK